MRGYIDSERVKSIFFWLMSSCLFAAVLCGVLGVWEVVDQLQVNRCLTTLGLIIGGAAVFYLINLAFGSAEPVDDRPSLDTAFSERLRKAKEFRQQS